MRSTGSSTSLGSEDCSQSQSSRRRFVDPRRRNEQEANALQDQRNIDTYDAYRYQPGYDEDMTALRVNPAAQIPSYDPRTNMVASSQSMAPLGMQHPYEHFFATVAPNETLLSNAPEMQGASPSGGLQQTNLPAAYAAHQSPQTGSVRPPPGAHHLDYLDMHRGHRPSQGLIWPANVDIGLVEICTFCPNWFMLPEPVARAIRNGWTREALGKVQLHALGALGWGEWLRAASRIQKQISAGCKLIDGIPAGKQYRHNSPDFRERHGPQDDLTATAWQFKAEYEPGTPVQTGHMPLASLYRDVVNWPVGNDRLLMTQCLEFSRNNEHLRLDTSHWDWIIQSQGLTAPSAPVGVNRDVEAYQNLNASIADPQDPRL